MRRRITALLFGMLCLLCACGVEVPEQTPLPEAEGLRIAVASDLHFDPEHTDKKAGLGAVAYNPELIDALLYDAKAQGAQLLLLTGDIVNAGKDDFHAALAEKLQRSPLRQRPPAHPAGAAGAGAHGAGDGVSAELPHRVQHAGSDR